MGQREYETGRGTELATGEVKYPRTLTNAEIKEIQGAVDKYSPRGDSVTVEIRDGNNNLIETKQVGITGGGVALANVIKDAKDNGYNDIKISEGVGRNEMQNFPQPQSTAPQPSGGFTMSNLSLLPTANAEVQNTEVQNTELSDVFRPMSLESFAKQAVDNATPEQQLDAYLGYGKDQGIEQIIVTDMSGIQTLVPIDTAKESIITTANEQGSVSYDYDTSVFAENAKAGMQDFISDVQGAGYTQISMVQDGKQINVPIDDKLLDKMMAQYNTGTLEYGLPFRDRAFGSQFKPSDGSLYGMLNNAFAGLTGGKDMTYDSVRESFDAGVTSDNKFISSASTLGRDAFGIGATVDNIVKQGEYEFGKFMSENETIQGISTELNKVSKPVVQNLQQFVPPQDIDEKKIVTVPEFSELSQNDGSRPPDLRISEAPLTGGVAGYIGYGVIPTVTYAFSSKSNYETEQYQQSLDNLPKVTDTMIAGMTREGAVPTVTSLLSFILPINKLPLVKVTKETIPVLLTQQTFKAQGLTKLQRLDNLLGGQEEQVFTAEGMIKQEKTIAYNLELGRIKDLGVAVGGARTTFYSSTPKAENLGLEKLAPEAGFEVSSQSKLLQKIMLDPNTEAYLGRVNPKFDNVFFDMLKMQKREAELSKEIIKNPEIIKMQRDDFGDQPQRGVDREITMTAFKTLVEFQSLKHRLQLLSQGQNISRLGAMKGSAIENLYYDELFTFGDMDFLVKKKDGESYARILSYELKDVVDKVSDGTMVPVAHYGDTSSSVVLSDVRSNVFYHGSTTDNIKQISQYGYDFSQAGTSTLQGFLAKGMGQARAEQMLRRLNPEGFYMTPNADLAQYFATKASDGAGGTIASVELKPWLKILYTDELSQTTKKTISDYMMDWSKVTDEASMIAEYKQGIVKYAHASGYEGISSKINILGKTDTETVIFSNDSILGVNRKWINEKDTKYFIDYDPTKPLTPDTKLVEFVQRSNMGESSGNLAGTSVFGTKYPKKTNTLGYSPAMPEIKGLKIESFMDQHLTRIASSSNTQLVRIGGDDVYRLLPPEHRIKDVVRKWMNNEVLIRDLRASENASGISSKQKLKYQNMADELENINKKQREANEAMGINYDEMIDFMRQDKTTMDFTGSTGVNLQGVGNVVGATSGVVDNLTTMTGNEPELGKYQFSNMSMEEVEKTFGLGGGTPMYKASSAEQSWGYDQDVYEGTNVYTPTNKMNFAPPNKTPEDLIVIQGWHNPNMPSARFISDQFEWTVYGDDIGHQIGNVESHESIHEAIQQILRDDGISPTDILYRKTQRGYDAFAYANPEFKADVTEALVGSNLQDLPDVLKLSDAWDGFSLPSNFIARYNQLKEKPPIDKESVRDPEMWIMDVKIQNQLGW
jgi:hypothetical protein